mgnify:FL=1
MASESRIIGLAGLIKETGGKVISGVADVVKSVTKTKTSNKYSTSVGTGSKTRKIVGKGSKKSRSRGGK